MLLGKKKLLQGSLSKFLLPHSFTLRFMFDGLMTFYIMIYYIALLCLYPWGTFIKIENQYDLGKKRMWI